MSSILCNQLNVDFTSKTQFKNVFLNMPKSLSQKSSWPFLRCACNLISPDREKLALKTSVSFYKNFFLALIFLRVQFATTELRHWSDDNWIFTNVEMNKSKPNLNFSFSSLGCSNNVQIHGLSHSFDGHITSWNYCFEKTSCIKRILFFDVR